MGIGVFVGVGEFRWAGSPDVLVAVGSPDVFVDVGATVAMPVNVAVGVIVVVAVAVGVGVAAWTPCSVAAARIRVDELLLHCQLTYKFAGPAALY